MRSNMRCFAVFLVICLVTFSGCVPPPTLTVTLETPANGSTVPSVTPMLAWSCYGPANSYHLQMANDANFQSVIIDVTNLGGVSYTIPAGNLSPDQTYYWRVSAIRDGQTSGWSAYSSFRTQTVRGAITVNANVDGAPWSGPVNYTITGPKADSSSSVPANYSDLPAGTYTLTYNSGGPPGATLVSISPSPTQTLASGSSINFSLNFHKQLAGTITVNAVVDGMPWSGQVNYTITGPMTDSNYSVPQTFSNLPAGAYTLTYNYGGPAGATLVSITPSPSQHLSTGGAMAFTLNFHRELGGTITVNAIVDGAPWSGPVDFTITGPTTDYSPSVPQSFGRQPPGVYTLTYNSGGPPGAMLIGITPSPTQNLAAGGSITFTLNFHRQQVAGTVVVNATLDGAPWKVAIGSGVVNYTISGPKSDASSTVPETFSNCPPGTYTLVYNSGGPIGATLASITPSPSQNLPPGGTVVFTMNFHGQAKGTVTVMAVIDGQPWSGPVSYTLNGPYVDSGYSVPETFSNCPQGVYTLSYKSGGPPSTVLERITPGPTQSLPPGGSVTFTLYFHFVGLPQEPGLLK